MRESKLLSTTHGLVASALAMGLLFAVTFEGAARPEPAAGTIRGSARVIDGDTLDIGDIRIRLEGIDAPEAGQTCKRKWIGSWPCGAVATAALAGMVENRSVSCEPRGLDKYGRTLAVCFVGGKDINAQMVRQGHAWAFVKYSQSYVKEEAQARAESLGIWQAESQPAWTTAPSAGPRPSKRRPRAAPSRATSPRTARSTTCPGVPGTRRSRSIPKRAN